MGALTISEQEIPRKVWTRQDAHTLLDIGFPNAQKLELIDGDLIDHTGRKRPHVVCHHLIHAGLVAAFGVPYVEMKPSIDVSPEDNPISEPEPDLIVTAKPLQDYLENPGPADIRLLIEVSDTSRRLDLGKKARLYARAGIADYWVIDIPQKCVHVHRSPERGAYTSIAQFGFDDEISPLADPTARICLNQLAR